MLLMSKGAGAASIRTDVYARRNYGTSGIPASPSVGGTGKSPLTSTPLHVVPVFVIFLIFLRFSYRFSQFSIELFARSLCP